MSLFNRKNGESDNGASGIFAFLCAVFLAAFRMVLDSRRMFVFSFLFLFSAYCVNWGALPRINPGSNAVVSTPKRDPVKVFPYLALETEASFDANIASVAIEITNYSSGNEVLSYVNSGVFSGSFDADTGILTITASSPQSFSNWKTELRKVTYANTGGSPLGSRAIKAVATPGTTGSYVYNPDNGHFYRFVDASVTWTAARSAALADSILGVNGYLLNVTTTEEHDFIAANLSSADAWIGANSDGPDAADFGDITTWHWEDGPEAGAVLSLPYFNWPGEPNGNGGGAYFWQNSYLWDNVPKDTTGKDYIVEFSLGFNAITVSWNTTIMTYADTPGITNQDIVTVALVTRNATPTLSFVLSPNPAMFKSATVTLVDPFAYESIGFLATSSVTLVPGVNAFSYTLSSSNALASTTWDDILARITYRMNRQIPAALVRQIRIDMAYPTTGNYVYDPVIGHFYYYHDVAQDRVGHQADIDVMSYNGMSAYFATLMSAEDQAIVSANLTRGNPAFMSGNDSAQPGTFRFTPGSPDVNLEFLFSKWAAGQPSGGETHVEMLATGEWNVSSSLSRRAIIEFGGLATDVIYDYTVTANIRISPAYSTGFGTNL